MRHRLSLVRISRRPAFLALLMLGCCAAASGCGGSSQEGKPVNWAEVESKVDPKLFLKKKAHGKGYEPVERGERRRILKEARKKTQE